jgi:hypothetical protein
MLSNFLIASISPDDELYQLERVQDVRSPNRGRYYICGIDRDGNGHLFNDPSFKKSNDKDEALRAFREWASAKGHEILEGESRHVAA